MPVPVKASFAPSSGRIAPGERRAARQHGGFRPPGGRCPPPDGAAAEGSMAVAAVWPLESNIRAKPVKTRGYENRGKRLSDFSQCRAAVGKRWVALLSPCFFWKKEKIHPRKIRTPHHGERGGAGAAEKGRAASFAFPTVAGECGRQDGGSPGGGRRRERGKEGRGEAERGRRGEGGIQTPRRRRTRRDTARGDSCAIMRAARTARRKGAGRARKARWSGERRRPGRRRRARAMRA